MIKEEPRRRTSECNKNNDDDKNPSLNLPSDGFRHLSK